jgi:hypothetical protein
VVTRRLPRPSGDRVDVAEGGVLGVPWSLFPMNALKGERSAAKCGDSGRRAGRFYEPVDAVEVIGDDRSISVIDRGEHDEAIDHVRMSGLSAQDCDVSCMLLGESLDPAAFDDVMQSMVAAAGSPGLCQDRSR